MSQTLHDSIERGFATRIGDDENGHTCQGCNNIFSVGEKVYRMNRQDGTKIQCTSLMCFKKQGGQIDEYQENTIIAAKSKCTSVTTSVKTTHTQDVNFRTSVIEACNKIFQIEEILLTEFKSTFEGENPSKLGMYVKLIQESMESN